MNYLRISQLSLMLAQIELANKYKVTYVFCNEVLINPLSELFAHVLHEDFMENMVDTIHDLLHLQYGIEYDFSTMDSEKIIDELTALMDETYPKYVVSLPPYEYDDSDYNLVYDAFEANTLNCFFSAKKAIKYKHQLDDERLATSYLVNNFAREWEDRNFIEDYEFSPNVVLECDEAKKDYLAEYGASLYTLTSAENLIPLLTKI